MKDIYKKLVKNTIFVGFADLAVKLKYFIFIPIFSKLIGATGFGVWVQIMVTVNMLLPLAILGTDASFMRFLPGKDKASIREDVSSMSIIVLVFSLLSGLAIFAFSKFLCVNFLKSVEYIDLVRLSAVFLTTFSLKELFIKYFRAMNKILLYSLFLVIESFVSILVVIIMIMLKYGIFGALLSVTVMNVVFLVLYLILILRDVGFCRPKFLNIRSYLHYSVPLIPMMWFLWVSNSFDRYLIGYFLGPKEVGIYAACYSISYFAVGIFASPILVVVAPMVTMFWNENDKEAAREVINRSIKFALFFMIPSILAFTLLAKPIILLITTPDFIKGIIIVPFILMGYLFYIVGALTENVTLLFKRTRVSLAMYGVSALLNIFLNILLIPRIGLLGAAISTFITFLVLMLAIIIFTIRIKFFIGYDYIFIFKSVFASFIMALFIFFFKPDSALQSIQAVFIGVVVYILIMVLSKGINKTEFNYIRDIFFNWTVAINGGSDAKKTTESFGK